ncbi:putative extracelular cellulose binding protein (Cip2) [Aspergillus melleus]|uniref:putative extracelular cellulose binding protein (Cip2) n=1 Tax=Aspergillus melleus TaxID=138277 RepID=UPI001E8DC316|nr:carbohydrate-binding module 1 [Aspergillus melleus]KAH8435119.1 carbohydrate-binding module 1 [Aspergillus melleus]
MLAWLTIITLVCVQVIAQCPDLPPLSELNVTSTLPDPFSWYPVTRADRVTSKEDWECRRQHISSLLQQVELGTKPPTPSDISASLSQNKLSITVSEGSKQIAFDVSITYPSGAGEGPFPAMIAYGGLSLPLPGGVATITFDNGVIAQQTDQSSRGKGLFYDLYGSDYSAGAMMAWAWGVSVILDALESTPSAKIDTTKVGVTGCSRNGKGALVAGAFDSRIALTVPQESGAGGSGCWRLCEAEDGGSGNVQTAGQIVQENVWFSSAFNSYVDQVNRLPFDHHMLAGLIAPRALLSIDNVGYEWLGPWSSLGCMSTAKLVWDALGVSDHMGYSLSTDHSHCAFPDQQKDDLDVYVRRFLLGEEVNTSVEKNYPGVEFDREEWVKWDFPLLQ